MTNTKKLISVVAPAYNEEECVAELARQLVVVMAELEEYEFEVIIVENGSSDNTWPTLMPVSSA
jgi:dolichol-phosphate mannosyltransferase